MNLEIFKSFMSHVNILFPLLKKKKKDLAHQNTVDNCLTVCVCVFIVLWPETVISVSTHTHAKVLR